jgi:predicted nucleotidyltransferase
VSKELGSDNMSDRNRILCEFRNKTKSIMGDSLKQMILYGSYARGDYGDNSDMDIMVLTELTDDRIIQIEDEIFDAAYDIELEYGVPISVNIKNEKHFKNWVNSLPYYSNIQKEGIIIA